MNNKAFNSAIQKYNGSFMSDTKWLKLIDALTDQLDEVHIDYKLIYTNEVRSISLDCSDIRPFFIEPILYKEVEWVRFPAIYEDYASMNNLKAGRTHFKQDIYGIEKIMRSLGQFPFEISSESIELYAYR